MAHLQNLIPAKIYHTKVYLYAQSSKSETVFVFGY